MECKKNVNYITVNLSLKSTEFHVKVLQCSAEWLPKYSISVLCLYFESIKKNAFLFNIQYIFDQIHKQKLSLTHFTDRILIVNTLNGQLIFDKEAKIIQWGKKVCKCC